MAKMHNKCHEFEPEVFRYARAQTDKQKNRQTNKYANTAITILLPSTWSKPTIFYCQPSGFQSFLVVFTDLRQNIQVTSNAKSIAIAMATFLCKKHTIAISLALRPNIKSVAIRFAVIIRICFIHKSSQIILSYHSFKVTRSISILTTVKLICSIYTMFWQKMQSVSVYLEQLP